MAGEYYRHTPEALSVQQNRNTQETAVVQQSTIRTTGEAVLVGGVLSDHSGCCAGTDEYYRSTREAVL